MTLLTTLIFSAMNWFFQTLNYAPEIKGKVEEKPIVIITASYNNQDFYENNLKSIFSQNYSNFRVIYTNDASTDETGKLVREYVKKHGKDLNFTYFENTENKGALHNIYDMIMLCKNEEIIVILDGDDRLFHRNVLDRLNRAYADQNVWVTYGQDAVLSGFGGHSKPMPITTLKEGTHRKYKFCWSHLRTFYAHLFKAIPKKYWKYDGLFYPTSSDVAMMVFLLDLAHEHVYFIPDILCLYNNENPLNDYKIDVMAQGWYRKYILKIPPLKKIKSIQKVL